MRIGNVKGCLAKDQKDVSHVTAARRPLILSSGHVDIPFICSFCNTEDIMSIQKCRRTSDTSFIR